LSVPRYVALFRGINVGKAKRIAMSDLRALLGKLGYTDVQTLLNSGNAVFTGDTGPASQHAGRIRQAVLKKLGVDALVIVKSGKDVAGIIADNELGGIAHDPARLLVAVTHERKALSRSGPWPEPNGATSGSRWANMPHTCGAQMASSKAKRRSLCSRV
jgi:uncharacterized protein (DUF1697 family)